MRAVLAVLLVTQAAATARADHELTLGSSSRALRSSSADAVTGDSLISRGVSYAHDLRTDIAVISVGGDATYGTASGTLFSTIGTEIRSATFTAAARARYPLASHLVAAARFELGMAHTSLELRDAMGTAASDGGWAPLAAGTLGLDLLVVDHPEFALGVRLELGYVAAASVGLASTPPAANDGTLRLHMVAASLGDLDLSGPSAGVALVSRF